MGSNLGVDKHVSNLEDILSMSPAHISKIKIESETPDSIVQHIKVNIFIY